MTLTAQPSGKRMATLGEFVAKQTKGIIPRQEPNARFELYSVPSYDRGLPEIVTGAEIGSNKQVEREGTVLLCKINPRINRSWVVTSYSLHTKIASTEWITFPPNDQFHPKYLAFYLRQETVPSLPPMPRASADR
jgi:type I restriction enzyme S subunit